MSGVIPVRQVAVRPGLERGQSAPMRVAWMTIRLIRRGVGWLIPVVAFYVAWSAC